MRLLLLGEGRWRLLALLIAVMLGGCLRLLYLSHQPFEADQIRDCFTIRDIAVRHKLVLIGPCAAPFPNLGPLYYYIIAPSMLFSQEPEAVCVWIALLNTASILLCYKLGCELFGEQVGLLSALLYAVSPTSVAFSKFIWNPNILPLFTTALLYSAAKVLGGASSYIIAVVPLAFAAAQIHPSGGAFIPILLALYLIYRPKLPSRKLLTATIISIPFLASSIIAAILPLMASTAIANVTIGRSQLPFTGRVIIPVDKAVIKAIADVSSGYAFSSRMHRADILISAARLTRLLLFTAGLLYVSYASIKDGRRAKPPYMLSLLWFIIPYLLLHYSYVGTSKYHVSGVCWHHVLWIIPLPSILVAFTLSKLSTIKVRWSYIILLLAAALLAGQLLHCILYPMSWRRSIADVRTAALTIANATGGDFYIEKYYPETDEKWHTMGIEYFLEAYGVRQNSSSNHRYVIVDLGLYKYRQIPINFSEIGGLHIKARVKDILLCEKPASLHTTGHIATLRDYPDLFKHKTLYNLTIVFGSQADASFARELLSEYSQSTPVYSAWSLTSMESGAIEWSKLPESNIVSIGGSLSNPLTKSILDSTLTPFYFTPVNGTWHLYSSLSGRDYTPIGSRVDYALILLTYQRGRWFLIACGYSPNGTEAACMVLKYPSIYRHILRGTAILIRWFDSNGNGTVDLRDDIALVEWLEQEL